MVHTSLFARPPIKWAPTLKKAIRQEERKKSRDVRKQKVYRIYEYPQLQSYKDMTSSGMMRLEAMERAERYLFEHSDLRLGSMQVKFINVMKIACLRKIFGDNLLPNMAFLQEKFGIKEMHDTVASLFPRRRYVNSYLFIFTLFTHLSSLLSAFLFFEFSNATTFSA